MSEWNALVGRAHLSNYFFLLLARLGLTGNESLASGVKDLFSGNGSLASGVKDLTSQLADAGKDLFSGLTDTASSARDSRQDNKSNDDENKASDP